MKIKILTFWLEITFRKTLKPMLQLMQDISLETGQDNSETEERYLRVKSQMKLEKKQRSNGKVPEQPPIPDMLMEGPY
ncbi:hypothetical protein D9M71_755560 [compost metagenome]